MVPKSACSNFLITRTYDQYPKRGYQSAIYGTEDRYLYHLHAITCRDGPIRTLHSPVMDLKKMAGATFERWISLDCSVNTQWQLTRIGRNMQCKVTKPGIMIKALKEREKGVTGRWQAILSAAVGFNVGKMWISPWRKKYNPWTPGLSLSV